MGNATRLVLGLVQAGMGCIGTRLLRCRRAVVATEYALLAGLVALAVTVGAGKLGSALNREFMSLASRLSY